MSYCRYVKLLYVKPGAKKCHSFDTVHISEDFHFCQLRLPYTCQEAESPQMISLIFQKSYESRFPRSFPENFSQPQLAMKPLLNSRPYWVTIIALLTKASGPFRAGYSLYGLPSGSCWKAWLHLWVTACQQSSLVSDRSRAQVTGSPNHHEVLQRVPGAQLHFLTITQLGSISSTALPSSHSAPRLARSGLRMFGH